MKNRDCLEVYLEKYAGSLGHHVIIMSSSTGDELELESTPICSYATFFIHKGTTCSQAFAKLFEG
jgi:hypothetical protein